MTSEAASKKPETPDAPPVHPAVAAQPVNEQQKEAKALRAELGPLVAELQRGEEALRGMGAALFAYHMVVEEGRKACAKMSAEDIQKYTRAFRSRFPGAWGAARTANVVVFHRHLRIAGFEVDPVEQYQKMMSVLSAP